MKITLISQVKKLDSGSPIQRILIGGFVILLFPLVIVLGVLIMLIALGISIFQKIGGDSHATNDAISDAKVIQDPWTIFTQIDDLTIWSRYKGEVRFGPAYLVLKTDPAVKGIDNMIFGDWLFVHRDGVFLQQWNSTTKANTTLVYLDGKNKTLTTIESSIDSVHWSMVLREDKIFELNCDTGNRVLKFEIKK